LTLSRPAAAGRFSQQNCCAVSSSFSAGVFYYFYVLIILINCSSSSSADLSAKILYPDDTSEFAFAAAAAADVALDIDIGEWHQIPVNVAATGNTTDANFRPLVASSFLNISLQPDEMSSSSSLLQPTLKKAFACDSIISFPYIILFIYIYIYIRSNRYCYCCCSCAHITKRGLKKQTSQQ
jgi:hypothetical protein